VTVLPFDPDPRLLGAFLALAVTAGAVVMGLALRTLIGRYMPEDDPRRQLIAQAMLYGGTFIVIAVRSGCGTTEGRAAMDVSRSIAGR
jgi:Kef-type K+ transport system membrane component KefB